MSRSTVENRILALFGSRLTSPSGVLHVGAVCKDRDNSLSVLRIRPDSPKSENDFFSLNLARARADAIVTTGRILREEPDVQHSLQPLLGDWRRETLLKTAAPISAVLTSGRDLDLDHPLLASSPSPLIFTSLEATTRLSEAATRREIELVASDAPTLLGLIDFLRSQRRARSISLEAGPSSVLPLYAQRPGVIDELMLSTYHGEVPETLRGAPFLSLRELEAVFAAHSQERSLEEASGRWSFRRYVRA